MTLQKELSFDSQAMWVIDVLGLLVFCDILFTGVCTTRHWKTSSRPVQKLSVCTVHTNGAVLSFVFVLIDAICSSLKMTVLVLVLPQWPLFL